MRLRALMLLGAAAAFAQTPAPTDAQAALRSVDIRALNALAMPTCLEPGMAQLQSGRIFARDRFLLKDGELCTFHLTEGQTKERMARTPLPPLDGDSGRFLKFRDDAFWHCDRSGVLCKWDGTLKRWIASAKLEGSFQDFDVLMDGRLLLLLPSSSPTAPKRDIVELYDPRAKTAEVLLPFPGHQPRQADAGLPILYWGSYRTFVMDEYVLIYGGLSGQLLCYDALKGSLREIGLPWRVFTLEDLQALFKAGDPRISESFGLMADGTCKPYYRLVPPVPVCAQFVPTVEGRVLMAYETVDPADESRKKGLLEIDLRTLEATPRSIPETLGLPFWVDAKGALAPLKDVLADAAR